MMIIGHPRQKVFLALGATDLRKAVDGLAAIVQSDFQLSPFEPCLFAFCNRRKDRVKILEWSPQGFWLHYFRVEQGRLPWPEKHESNPVDVTGHDLSRLLEGIPLGSAEQRQIRIPKYMA
jgi:transposase